MSVNLTLLCSPYPDKSHTYIYILYGGQEIKQVMSTTHSQNTCSHFRAFTESKKRILFNGWTGFSSSWSQSLCLNQPLPKYNNYLCSGSELWNSMAIAETKPVNRLQQFVAKKIQGLSTRSRSDMSESIPRSY